MWFAATYSMCACMTRYLQEANLKMLKMLRSHAYLCDGKEQSLDP